VEKQLQGMIPNTVWRVLAPMKVVCVFKKWSALNNATHKTREEGPHSKVTRLKGFFNREVTARDNPEELQMRRGLAMKVA
jgi:hypothetical protein